MQNIRVTENGWNSLDSLFKKIPFERTKETKWLCRFVESQSNKAAPFVCSSGSVPTVFMCSVVTRGESTHRLRSGVHTERCQGWCRRYRPTVHAARHGEWYRYQL